VSNSLYTTRLVWQRSAVMERELAQSKAHALLKKLEEMQFDRCSHSAIWRTAVIARAYALLAQDRVAAENALSIAGRYAPEKSLAERRAIHRRAVAVLARLTPSSSRAQNWESRHRSSSLSAAEQRRVHAWLARERKRLGR
jgi:hypothetical protein